MKIQIDGKPKEIAELVSALQKQPQEDTGIVVTLDGKSIAESVCKYTDDRLKNSALRT